MGITVSGLDDLIRDLESLAAEAPKKLARVAGRGAMNIKAGWKRRWSPRIGGGLEHLPHVVRGIGYDDVTKNPTDILFEIGVSRNNPQASLAHFAEFGLVNQAPFPGGLPALREEDPKFVQAVGDKAVELLEGRQ